MYTIAKEFHFSASHVLSGLQEDHPCGRLHGHNYVIRVHLKSDSLDEVGFITDYRELDAIKKYIDNQLDHRHLNDVLGFNPTAENMSLYFYEMFKGFNKFIYAVEVEETPKTIARYEGI
jgi:6-pyruvoyltetrahydropterin/6-carboxytetrahydropterin synthase